MFYRLFSSNTQDLLHRPETGMGYQIVEIRKNYRAFTEKMVVLNSELAFDIDSYDRYRGQMINEGYAKMFSQASFLSDITIVRVLQHPNARLSGGLMESSRSFSAETKGAIDNPEEKADGSEVFVRISAYADDRRVDKENKCLRPGSFATTFEDYAYTVKSKLDPVARYALPNTEVTKWAFAIKPKSGDTLQRGKVQPANGQPGGGDEAYFKNGTSKGTYLLMKPYGEL